MWDILGFWPVRLHPLAGRSYREQVAREFADLVDQNAANVVVLVGHSQGSVLVAGWQPR